MTQIIALSWEYEVSTQPVLDQRKQNRRGSVEKYEHTSSKLNTSSRNLNNSHNLSLPPHNPPCKKWIFNLEGLCLYYVSFLYQAIDGAISSAGVHLECSIGCACLCQ